MQGRNTNVIKLVDVLKAFKAKLVNCKRKIKICNFAMFQKVDMLLDNKENKISKKIESDNLEHLSAFKNQFERYFPARQLIKTWIL